MRIVSLTAAFIFSGSLMVCAQDVKPLSSPAQVDSLIGSYSGKVLIVNLWATWCDPCVEEFPDLVKLYQNYKDKNLALVFVSLDQPGDLNTKVLPFLKSNGVDFVTYINKFKKQEDLINAIDKDWDGAIPATYIYDSRGKMIGTLIGGKTYAEFEKVIREDIPN